MAVERTAGLPCQYFGNAKQDKNTNSFLSAIQQGLFLSKKHKILQDSDDSRGLPKGRLASLKFLRWHDLAS